MPSREESVRMFDFVFGLVGNSGLYEIIRQDGNELLVDEKPEHLPSDREDREPRRILLIAHNQKMPEKKFIRLTSGAKGRGEYVAHVLYKDGITFMVRLGALGNFKRDDKSLKRYGRDDVNKMIHLSGMEKWVIDDTGHHVAYYQPETERLKEGVRVYELKNVSLDYDHLTDNDGFKKVFAKSGISKDYKLARETWAFSGRTRFRFPVSGHLSAIITPFELSVSS